MKNNPVAKNLHKFNKPKVEKDRKNEYDRQKSKKEERDAKVQ